MKKLTVISFLFFVATSCTFEKLYNLQQRRKTSSYEQIEFGDLAKIYFSKDQTSMGTVEGIYSISSLVTKKGKGILSSTEKERTTERKENYSTVAIIRDTRNPRRDYMEIPLDKNFLPSYSIRGEFTGLTEGNVMVYKQLESRGRESSYTFTYDKSRDILEGIRTENEGSFTYTYRLTYLKLFPKAGTEIKKK
jgi:hypothetical protein